MSNVVVIDFTAVWCGPCRMQEPIIDELKKEFEGKVEFKKIDVDQNGELADKYNIMAVPTLIIEKDGNIFKKYVGLTKTQSLVDAINNALE